MMTVSLTFDDGLKAHRTIVAPMLRHYGWIGAFNVCTDFLEESPDSLTPEKLAILGLQEHPKCRMNWEDARALLGGGHEVYPHSCSHARLGVLAEEGRMEDLRHEIEDSKKAFEEKLRVSPKYFCCPHLEWTPVVRDMIASCGMKMFNNWRPGIGGDNAKDVEPVLLRLYREGRRHIDLMFHGIVAREGGHNAFADESEFKGVLEVLKHLENLGVIKIVPYAKARRGYLLTKARRVVFRLFPAVVRRRIGAVLSQQ